MYIDGLIPLCFSKFSPFYLGLRNTMELDKVISFLGLMLIIVKDMSSQMPRNLEIATLSGIISDCVTFKCFDVTLQNL